MPFAATPVNTRFPQNAPWGAALILAAFFLVALMSAIGRELAGVSALTICFFQYAFSLLALLPWILRGGRASLRTARPVLQTVRALAGLASQALMFVAIRRMPLLNAVLLSNSAPLFIPLVARLWLKEPFRPSILASLGLGFAGVLLILQPGRELFTHPASWLAVAAALCSAIALVSVNQLSRNDSVEKVLFYYYLIGTLATALWLPLGWIPLSAGQCGLLLGIGACMSASQLLIVLAYRYATPSLIAPYNYSVVVFSGLLSWLIWREVPSRLAVAGVVLVCAGGVLSTLLSRPHARGHFLWIGHRNVSQAHVSAGEPA